MTHEPPGDRTRARAPVVTIRSVDIRDERWRPGADVTFRGPPRPVAPGETLTLSIEFIEQRCGPIQAELWVGPVGAEHPPPWHGEIPHPPVGSQRGSLAVVEPIGACPLHLGAPLALDLHVADDAAGAGLVEIHLMVLCRENGGQGWCVLAVVPLRFDIGFEAPATPRLDSVVFEGRGVIGAAPFCPGDRSEGECLPEHSPILVDGSRLTDPFTMTAVGGASYVVRETSRPGGRAGGRGRKLFQSIERASDGRFRLQLSQDLEAGVHDFVLEWLDDADRPAGLTQHRLLVTPGRPLVPFDTAAYPPLFRVYEWALTWIAQQRPWQDAPQALELALYLTMQGAGWVYDPAGSKIFHRWSRQGHGDGPTVRAEISNWESWVLEGTVSTRDYGRPPSVSCDSIALVLHTVMAMVGHRAEVLAIGPNWERYPYAFLDTHRVNAFGCQPWRYPADGRISRHAMVVEDRRGAVSGSGAESDDGEGCGVYDSCFMVGDGSESRSGAAPMEHSGGRPLREYLERLLVEHDDELQDGDLDGIRYSRMEVAEPIAGEERRAGSPPAPPERALLRVMQLEHYQTVERRLARRERTSTESVDMLLRPTGAEAALGYVTVRVSSPAEPLPEPATRESWSTESLVGARSARKRHGATRQEPKMTLSLAGPHPAYHTAHLHDEENDVAIRLEWLGGLGPPWMSELPARLTPEPARVGPEPHSAPPAPPGGVPKRGPALLPSGEKPARGDADDAAGDLWARLGRTLAKLG